MQHAAMGSEQRNSGGSSSSSSARIETARERQPAAVHQWLWRPEPMCADVMRAGGVRVHVRVGERQQR